MPVDRVLFTSNFSKHSEPNWPCMACRGGHLRIRPNSILYQATAESIRASAHEAHELEWDTLMGVAIVVCDNPKCKESAAIVAEGKWHQDGNCDTQHLDYTAYFLPTHFCPSPPLIEVPANCPEAAHAEIKLAFVSSWGDPAAAANHIRTAVERLLDARRINKMITRSTGKKRMPLHDRIELLQDQRAPRLRGVDGDQVARERGESHRRSESRGRVQGFRYLRSSPPRSVYRARQEDRPPHCLDQHPQRAAKCKASITIHPVNAGLPRRSIHVVLLPLSAETKVTVEREGIATGLPHRLAHVRDFTVLTLLLGSEVSTVTTHLLLAASA